MAESFSIGIESVGTYLPKKVITGEEIAEQSGIPEWVVKEKFGIEKKYKASSEEHPNLMGIWAAQDAFSRSNIKPEEVDIILNTTEEWKEYILWTAGVNMAHELGAVNAWGMDMHIRCATTIGALKIAKGLMQSDPEVNTILIAGGYSVGDFINFNNHRTSFMFNIGAGAGAMILRRNYPKNHILGTHLISDGSMSNHVIVPSSGTKSFPTDEAVKKDEFYFDLVEPDAMKDRLNKVSMDNWVKCVDESLRKSGKKPDGTAYTESDIDYLNMILIKPSGHKDMLSRLGLTEEQSAYLGHIGHIGEQDAMFSIQEGLKTGKLNNGDLMMIVAAGIGYVWGAAAVQWGEVIE